MIGVEPFLLLRVQQGEINQLLLDGTLLQRQLTERLASLILEGALTIVTCSKRRYPFPKLLGVFAS